MKETSGGGGRKQGAIAPCAACKLLRRRCAQDCVFAPYFPADEPHKFASVHKVFGASNVNKMLQELPEHQRSDAVSSMVYEANARVRDPVYGCVGAISSLQQQIDALQSQLAIAQAEVVHMRLHQYPSTPNPATNYNNIFSENKHNIICSNSTSHSPHQTKSFFTMDLVIDNNNNNNNNNNHHHHPNIGESLWSC